MKKKTLSKIAATALALAIVTAPGIGSAQQAAQEESGPIRARQHPFVNTSFSSEIGYLRRHTSYRSSGLCRDTYGVEGAYDGGTNGRDIGETARRSCTGDWVIPASQVRKDYGS